MREESVGNYVKGRCLISIKAAAAGRHYASCGGSDGSPIMFAHLLIATDGSEFAEKAETAGLCLAKRIGARVTIMTATEPWSAMTIGEPPAFNFPIDEYENAARRHAEEILARVSKAAAKLGIMCDAEHVLDFPAEAIIETAKARACDLIVMASHGRRGLKKLMLGSQAQRVVTLSTLPVLICR